MARYRTFIAPRLLGSLAALAFLPGYLVLRGAPSGIEIAVLSWLVTPLLVVRYLSRTGRFEAAHILSSLSLTGLAFFVAFFTGGIGSFAAIWLAVAPFEASLSSSRRVVLMSMMFSLIAALLLLLLGVAGALSYPVGSELHAGVPAFATIAASLFASGFALGSVSLASTGEQLLSNAEDRYRFISENATDVIVRYGRGGTVLYISPSAEMLFGISVSELAAGGLLEHVHVSDRPAFLTALADAADSADEQSLELRIRRDAGVNRPSQVVWVEMRCWPLENVDKERDRPDVVAVLRDISERKAQEEAIEAARLQSKRRTVFVATVSHELRTPLNAIIGFSEILMNGSLKTPSSQAEYAKLINDSGHHLLSVVNGILDASRIEGGHFRLAQESFAPGPVIENAVDLLALQAREAGVELRHRLAENLPDIAADKRALAQILINLASNGIKFTPHGGSVTISAACDGPKLMLTVEDTGVGIGRDDLPRLGEAFFQASATSGRRHEGSGLGLSIVKGLVKLLNGEISIRSRLGEGTRVTVHLPLGDSSRRAPVEPIKLMAGGARGSQDFSNDWVRKSA